MKKINKIVDEYMCYEIDCDIDCEDRFIKSVRNEDIVIKKTGLLKRVRNLFTACFV
jgi:hypothetical protein